MPWARFADDYLGNNKLTGLSTVAICLDVAGIIYSARELRDGMLSARDLQTIASLIHLKAWQGRAAELVEAGRWTQAGDGYVIHDYLDYQPSRDQVLRERAAAAARMRGVRANSGRSPGERSPEVRKKFSDPGPGPGPGPERSKERSINGSLSSDEVRANGAHVGGACCPQAEASSGRIHDVRCSQRTEAQA